MIDGRHAGHAMYITAGYAAPEQYNGDGSVRSDIYSIGILLLYMASSGHVQSFTSEAESVCRIVFKFNWTCYKKVISGTIRSKI